MKKILILLLISLTVLSLYPTDCFAAESQGFPFTAEIIAPVDQIGNVGYYHIPGQSGEEITLQAKLSNLTSESLEIKVVPMNAYSSQEGIFYQSPLEANAEHYALTDEKYNMAQYITAVEPVTLTANQTQVVSFTVTVPDLTTGTLLGGIRFVVFDGTQELQKGDKDLGNSQILIDKYQAMDFAIQIDFSQQDKTSISVGDPIFDGENIGVSLWFVNQAAMIQEKISGTYDIRSKDNTVLFSGAIDEFRMSPMAEFRKSLSWQYKTLEEGSYTLSLKLDVDGENKSFDKVFAINQKDVTDAQQAQAKINPEIEAGYPVWIWLVIGIFALAIVFISIKYLRLRQRANKKK